MRKDFLTWAGALLLVWACLGACQPSGRNPPAGGDGASATGLTGEARQWVETLDYRDDDRDLERRLAAIQLGVHQTAGATEMLAKHLMGDRDPGVRATCAYALGRIGGKRAVQTLIAALADSMPEVAEEAVRALAGHVDDQVAERLAELAGRDDDETTLLAIRVLGEAGRLNANQTRQLLHKTTSPPLPARGNTIYVDPAARDDTGSGEEGQPAKTIAKGLSLLVPSGTLFVAGLPGGKPIREPVKVPGRLSGRREAPTRIVAWPGKRRPLLQPTIPLAGAGFAPVGGGVFRAKVEQKIFGAFWVVGGQTRTLVLVEKRDGLQPNTCWYDEQRRELLVRIQGETLAGELELAIAEDALSIEGASDFEVRGLDVRYAPDSGLDAGGAFRVSFVDCSASYCDRHGIFIYYSPFALLRSCRADHCNYQGFSVRSSPQTLVSRCVSEDNGVDGILFLFDSDHATAIDCLVRRNQRGISFIRGSDYGRVIACEIHDNRSNEIAFENGSFGGEIVEAQ